MDVDFDGWAFGHADAFVVGEILLNDGTVVDGDFAEQGGAETEEDATFHLRFEAIGVYGHAAISGGGYAANLYVAVIGDFDFRYVGDDGAEAFGDGDASSMSRRQRRAPGGLLGGEI